MIDFFGSGYDAAEQMELIPRLEQVRYSVSRLVYVNKNGRPSSWVDFEAFRRLQNGRLMSLMRGDLEKVLFEAVPRSVEIRFNRTIDAIADGSAGVDVILSDGTHEIADLVVGADGVHSRVRELSFGHEDQFLRYLQLQTAAYTFEDRGSEDLNGQFMNLTVPGREVGFYPIRGQRIASFFVHRTTDAGLPRSPCAELRRIYGNLGWIVPEALSRCGEASSVYYDRVVQIEMNAWSRGRTALLGDACCAVSLLAGQGASIAMGSAYVLAEELSSSCAVEEALARYEARVKPVVARKQAIGRQIANWIVPPSQWRIVLRDEALNLTHWPGFSWILRPLLAGGSESIVRDAVRQKRERAVA